MARDGGVSCLRRSEISGGGNFESDDVHVLAVDDSLIDRIVIEKLLRITSCKVTAVDSGRRALQFLGLDGENSSGFDRLKVDLIITDYCMPGMTGYDLLKKIKESSSFREIPVVIMSSENVLTRIDRCLEEGAEDFLLKPVKLDDVKRLRNYLTRDVNVLKGNKRKLPEDSGNLSTPTLPSSKSPELSDSCQPQSPTDIMSPSPASPAETLSLSSSSLVDTMSLSPQSLEEISSPSPSSPEDDIESSPSPSPSHSSSPSPSPSRRQKMTSPGLD